MTYAAYLRIYEPVAAFHEPDRSRWAAYAASPARPRRRDSLTVEHAEALRRAIAAPQVVVPDEESEHAYVRRADGVTYVCPWQTRLRCLLSYGRMISATGSALPGLVPARDEQQTTNDLTRLADQGPHGPATRLHILASVWTVPLAWFVPFAAAERWLALGPGAKRPAGPQTASATRALLYTTPMSRARRRVARERRTERLEGPCALDDLRNPCETNSVHGQSGAWRAWRKSRYGRSARAQRHAHPPRPVRLDTSIVQVRLQTEKLDRVQR